MHKKSQLGSEVFKYMLIALVAGVILIFGYMMLRSVLQKGCTTELTDFTANFRNIDKSSRYGEMELKEYSVPCKADKIYLFDFSKSINYAQFSQIPIMQDSLKTSKNDNVFLVEENKVLNSFYAGKFEIEDSYLCLKTSSGKISFFAEGSKDALRISRPQGQPACA